MQAAATAGPNIALIKYWGNRDPELRIPANGSISITLAGLEVQVRVRFADEQPEDALILNGTPASPEALARASAFLDVVRRLAGVRARAQIESSANFPVGAGLASSAAAYAALAQASSAAAGLRLDLPALSRLARRGSGSACRSVFAGYAEWSPGDDDATSLATCLAPPEHWGLVDVIAVVDEAPKPVGSSQGHALAPTSPLQAARVSDAARRLDLCRQAIRSRDFDALAQVVELDSNMMHAVMLTSSPPLVYWQPTSLAILHAVAAWRRGGLPVCYTMDAGSTVHCLCDPSAADEVAGRLRSIEGVARLFQCPPGDGVRLLERS